MINVRMMIILRITDCDPGALLDFTVGSHCDHSAIILRAGAAERLALLSSAELGQSSPNRMPI